MEVRRGLCYLGKGNDPSWQQEPGSPAPKECWLTQLSASLLQPTVGSGYMHWLLYCPRPNTDTGQRLHEQWSKKKERDRLECQEITRVIEYNHSEQLQSSSLWCYCVWTCYFIDDGATQGCKSERSSTGQQAGLSVPTHCPSRNKI